MALLTIYWRKEESQPPATIEDWLSSSLLLSQTVGWSWLCLFCLFVKYVYLFINLGQFAYLLFGPFKKQSNFKLPLLVFISFKANDFLFFLHLSVSKSKSSSGFVFQFSLLLIYGSGWFNFAHFCIFSANLSCLISLKYKINGFKPKLWL